MDPLVALAIAVFPDLMGIVSTDPASDIGPKIAKAVKDATGVDTFDAAKAKLADRTQAAVLVDLKGRLMKIAADAGVSTPSFGQLAQDAQDAENTQDARKTMLSLATINESRTSTPAIISYIVIIGFVALVFMLVIGYAPGLRVPAAGAGAAGGGSDATLSQVANLCIGALATSFATVLNFWLGSSLGSRRKDAPAAQASTVEQAQKINQATQPATG